MIMMMMMMFTHHRYGCMRKVVEKDADVTWVQAEDVYVAREVYDDQLHVLGEIRKAEEKECKKKLFYSV